MTDYDQSVLAQIGVLKAAVSALFVSHPDHHVLRDEFRLHAAMIRVANAGLGDVAKQEANALITALVDSLGHD